MLLCLTNNSADVSDGFLNEEQWVHALQSTHKRWTLTALSQQLEDIGYEIVHVIGEQSYLQWAGTVDDKVTIALAYMSK
jgi:hypothetical protein